MSPAEAATALAVSRRTLTRLIRDGKITARKCNRRTLIDAASLRRYFEGLPPIDGPAPLFPPRNARRRRVVRQ
jgi:excisionase family DNA binding protein